MINNIVLSYLEKTLLNLFKRRNELLGVDTDELAEVCELIKKNIECLGDLKNRFCEDSL